MNKRFLLIDGNSIIYRCFHAVYPKDPNVLPAKIKENFFDLFTSQLRKWLKLNSYGYGLLALDVDRKSFRTEILPIYKANREPMPQELVDWFPEIILKAREEGINALYAPRGYEADDLIGTLSRQLSEADYRVDIITIDKDLLQLVNHLVSVIRIKISSGLEINNHQNFSELNEGLSPFQIPLLKALAGDSSDNYSGIPGIGPKNATKLITDYQTKERLLSSLDNLPESRIKRSLQANLETLEKCLQLATIQTKIRFKYSLSDFTIKSENNSRTRKSN
ncbi:DNA polymerase I [Mycoplasma wenyonii str. Massachusetts]|uniref:5'-3' exonuclease n=1 Tax=Mycoplasma wenyonii (strain Massachusetts) TaxID=1197325 RepID=I6ZED3_MYCWM|nr:5'-3' exonuclease [Mycoplasma wenyonii]AFN64942.1 DNA polymerase I [Mycoplasma wenyonii str. Massachusetts]